MPEMRKFRIEIQEEEPRRGGGMKWGDRFLWEVELPKGSAGDLAESVQLRARAIQENVPQRVET